MEDAQFFRALREAVFPICRLMVGTSHSIILTQNTPSYLEIEPDNSKQLYFEQISSHSLNFEPLLPLISRLNLKFRYSNVFVFT